MTRRILLFLPCLTLAVFLGAGLRSAYAMDDLACDTPAEQAFVMIDQRTCAAPPNFSERTWTGAGVGKDYTFQNDIADSITAANARNLKSGDINIVVDKFGICRYLDNIYGNGYFVPFKTSSEWFSFLDNISNLTGVSADACALGQPVTPVLNGCDSPTSGDLARGRAGSTPDTNTLIYSNKVFHQNWQRKVPSTCVSGSHQEDVYRPAGCVPGRAGCVRSTITVVDYSPCCVIEESSTSCTVPTGSITWETSASGTGRARVGSWGEFSRDDPTCDPDAPSEPLPPTCNTTCGSDGLLRNCRNEIVGQCATYDGECGSSNGTLVDPPTDLCAIGGPSVPVRNGNQWTWNCAGSEGRATATCQTLPSETAPGYATSFYVVGWDPDVAGDTNLTIPTFSRRNPYTSGYACPPGTIDDNIAPLWWGRMGFADIHACTQDSPTSPSFYTNAGNPLLRRPNRVTGDTSCPAGMTDRKILTTVINGQGWYDVHSCTIEPVADSSKVFSSYTPMPFNSQPTYANPYTGSYACPSGTVTVDSILTYDSSGWGNVLSWGALYTCVQLQPGQCYSWIHRRISNNGETYSMPEWEVIYWESNRQINTCLPHDSRLHYTCTNGTLNLSGRSGDEEYDPNCFGDPTPQPNGGD